MFISGEHLALCQQLLDIMRSVVVLSGGAGVLILTFLSHHTEYLI